MTPKVLRDFENPFKNLAPPPKATAQRQVQIRALRAFFVGGTLVAVGDVVSLPEFLANDLIHVKRAEHVQ